MYKNRLQLLLTVATTALVVILIMDDKSIICRIKGHKWKRMGTYERRCKRCGKVEYKEYDKDKGTIWK